jgi:hypothetical protein
VIQCLDLLLGSFACEIVLLCVVLVLFIKIILMPINFITVCKLL